MDMTTLQTSLTDVYKETMGYSFQRDTYERDMQKLTEKYQDLLNALEEACCASGEASEQIASCVPEYVLGELEKISSKRKRDKEAFAHNMNMVTFFMPFLGQAPSLPVKDTVKRMVEIWNGKLPCEKISYTTYDSIQAGFKRGTFCYITTAVCRTLGRPDDCGELETLRDYRDHYLMSDPEGESLVQEYYNIAPTIVKRIGKSGKADEIYRDIWEEYLSPCIRLIEQDRKEDCRSLYTSMVKKLEEQYLYSG